MIAVNSKPVRDFEDLRKHLGELEPGSQAEITYRRHKEKADGHDETTVKIDVVDRETFWKAELDKQAVEEKP